MKPFITVVIFIFFLLFCSDVHGQDKDSVLHVLASEQTDSARISTLFELASILYLPNPDTTILICEEILQLAQKNNDEKNIAETYGWLGYLYGNIGKVDKALEYDLLAAKSLGEIGDSASQAICYINIATILDDKGEINEALNYYSKSLEIQKKINDKQGQAISLNNVAYILNNLGDIEQAISYWMKCLKIQEEVDDKKGIATITNNLASTYSKLGNQEKALEFYQKSLKIYEEINDNRGLAISYKNIGSLYLESGNDSMARNYFHKSFNLNQKLNNLSGLADNYIDLANLYQMAGKMDSAFILNKKALSVYQSIKDKSGLANSFMRIGRLFFLNGNYAKALRNTQKAHKLNTELGYPTPIEESAGLLKQIYLKDKNYKKAYEYYSLEMEMRDSLVNEKNYKSLIQQQSKFDYLKQAAIDSIAFQAKLDLNMAKTNRIKAENLARKKQIYNMILALFAMFILIIVAIINYFKRKKAYQLLEIKSVETKQKNEELNQQNEEIKAINEKLRNQQEQIEKQNIQLTKYFTAIEQSPIAIVITDENGKIEYVNPFFTKISGYTLSEVLDKTPNIFKSDSTRSSIYEELWQAILAGKVWRGEFINLRKDGSEFIEKSIIAPIKDKKGKIINFIALKEDITKTRELEDKLLHEKNRVFAAHQENTDSLNYARRIQKAVFPENNFFEHNFADYFIYFRPLGVVSGDFYWAKKVENTLLFAVADSTGHGVPGAFVSMLGISLLNEIFHEKEIKKASAVLDTMRIRIKEVLNQFSSSRNKDGIDIALCILDTETYRMQYAGAYNPIYVLEKNTNELRIIQADRQPIGVFLKEEAFTNQLIELNVEDQIYLFTDGYRDQFGGEKQKKFKSSRFKSLIQSIAQKPFANQKKILENTFENWIKDTKQIDDVTVMGLKIK